MAPISVGPFGALYMDTVPSVLSDSPQTAVGHRYIVSVGHSFGASNSSSGSVRSDSNLNIVASFAKHSSGPDAPYADAL